MFNGIEHYDVFDDVVIFWIDLSDPPRSIQRKARRIDKQEYTPNCFGLCVGYDVDSNEFYMVEDTIVNGQRGNIYYIDNCGDKTWFKAEITSELINEVFSACKKELLKRG